MARTVCINTEIDGQHSVSLIQDGVDRFEVIYGADHSGPLHYDMAAARYGECVMHALACAGRLDNTER